MSNPKRPRLQERFLMNPLDKNKLILWSRENVPSDSMLWKGSFGNQIAFVREDLTNLVGANLDWEDKMEIVDVISTHCSKSIVLPVYKLERKDLGLTIVLRNNFYNWKMSVIVERDYMIPTDQLHHTLNTLFHTTPPIAPDYTGNELASVYFEGFPEEFIFGYFTENPKRFSAQIHGDLRLYTTIHAIMNALGALSAITWHTPETHRAELDARDERRKARALTKRKDS